MTKITIKEFSWRTLASIFWLLMVMPVIVLTFTVLSELSIWSPFSWIQSSILILSSFSSLVVCFTLQIISVISVFAHHRVLSVYKHPRGENMKLLLFLLHPNQLLSILCFSSYSMLVTIVLLWLKSSSDSNTEVVSYFPVTCSAFVGCYYGVRYYMNHSYQLKFPVIQQKKLFRLKKTIQPSIQESSCFAFSAMKIFVALYLVTSLLPAMLFPLLFNVETRGIMCAYLLRNLPRTIYNNYSGDSVFYSIYRVLNIASIWRCFVTAFIVSFLLIISNKILHVFSTQLLSFPIDATFIEDEGRTLSDGMASMNPVIKYLSYLDYVTVSRTESSRRKKMFALTIPGNQPHTWWKTYMSCLQLLQTQRMELNNECERKEMTKRVFQSQAATPKIIGQQELFSPETAAPVNTGVLKTDIPEGPGKKQMLPNKPLFQDLQIVIWAIEGLCNLVACSLHGDVYGVVQKSSPDIITELFLLLEACDSYSKVSMLQNPLASTVKELGKMQMENIDVASLKIALKSGLYTITSSFKHHIMALRLSGDHKKRLHAFLEYDE